MLIQDLDHSQRVAVHATMTSKGKQVSSEDEEEYDSQSDEDFRKELIEGLLSDDDDDDDDDDDLDDVEDEQVTAHAEDSVEEYDDELYKGEEDRRKLEAMTQLQREQILYDREQRRNKWLSRVEAMAQKNREKRVRPVTKASGALQDIRDRRSHRGNRGKQSISNYMDEDVEEGVYFSDDEDEEFVSGKRRGRATDEQLRKQQKVQKKPVESVFLTTKTKLDLKTVKELQIRRTALENLFREPFFEEYCKDMFVRVSARQSSSTGRPVYVMAQIHGIVSGSSSYAFADAQTSTKLQLAIGKDIQAFRMTAISNQGISQDQFEAWEKAMESQGLSVLSCEQALKLKIEHEVLRKSYRYSHEDVQNMIKRTRSGQLSKLNVTKEISDLELLRSEALQKGKKGEAERLLLQIESLRAKQAAMLDKKYGTGLEGVGVKKRPRYYSAPPTAGDAGVKSGSGEFVPVNPSKRQRTFGKSVFEQEQERVKKEDVVENVGEEIPLGQVIPVEQLEKVFGNHNTSKEHISLLTTHSVRLVQEEHVKHVSNKLLSLDPLSFCQYIPFTDRSVFDKVLSIEQYSSALAD